MAATVSAETPVDRFIASLDAQATLPLEAREMIRRSWKDCGDCDGEEFLTQGLAVLSARFREGLDAYDADQYEKCATIMRDLIAHANPFVSAQARVYEIKSLVSADHLLEAGARIAALGPDGKALVEQYSYFLAEVTFLRAYCLLADLEYAAAGDALSDFVADFPGAPPRLTVPARQMLLELGNRRPGRIGDVVDLLDYSRRRLGHVDFGPRVQERQQRAVALLDRLIEEAQQREQGGGGSSGRTRGRSPSAPAPHSQLPDGEAEEGPLRDGRRADPAEVWGAMPPTQREQVLQALKESFPSRYRQLVEQYYEELAKKP
jgi:hypothetical protein